MRFGLMAAAAACVVAAPAQAATQVIEGSLSSSSPEQIALDLGITTTGRWLLRVEADSPISTDLLAQYLRTVVYYDPRFGFSSDQRLEDLFEVRGPATFIETVFARPNRVNLGDGQYRLNGYQFYNLDLALSGPQGTGYRVTFSSLPAAVPEPATWALMILGLAAASGAMRRKSTHKYLPPSPAAWPRSSRG